MSKLLGRIVRGCQIKAARALLGWSREQLATAANLHPNTVTYWEETPVIRTSRHEPHACTKIREPFRFHV